MSAPANLTADLTADLTDADRAAVMVMLLDEEQAARILAELGPEELRILGEKMCALGDIKPDVIQHAIAGFVTRNEEVAYAAHDRVGQVRSLMTRAVGDVKADNLLQRIAPDAPSASTVELARWLTPLALIPLIADEHPQAIAVLLVQLDPEIAAEVLHGLPWPMQSEVVHRIATLGPVPAEALSMLDEMLSRNIAERHGQAALTMGGVRMAADLINSAGKAVEKRVMPDITKADKALAKVIENEMFKFEHLFALDPQAMGALLRDVESEVLIDALKGTEEESREVFFKAMSSRAADGVRDEIAARGRLKMAEVVEAQRQIVAVARRLAADGTISFGQSEDEYV
jgi:flagellar motor switch protein FliG